MKTRKFAVVGSRSVGKSSMTVKYVEDHFVESYYPTIENNFSKQVSYRGQQYTIEILDTAGQDEFSIMNEKHLIGFHGYILVYSVTSWQSFELVDIIRDKILDSLGRENVPLVLVGNKCDLDYQRQVEGADGEKKAREFGCPFFETSVKEGVNVDSAFEGLLAEIEGDQENASKCLLM